MKKQPLSLWAMQIVLVALATLLSTGCQHVNHLRDAQASFNTAAELENQTKFNPVAAASFSSADESAADRLTSLNSATSGYAAALLSLKSMPDDQVNALKQDKLWGNALTLQALCEWKLKKYEDALKTADLANANGSDQLYPRDAALLEGLPGLIRTDLALDSIRQNMPPLISNPPNATAEDVRVTMEKNAEILEANQTTFAREIAPKLIVFDSKREIPTDVTDALLKEKLKNLLEGKSISQGPTVDEIMSSLNVSSIKELLIDGAIKDLQEAIKKAGPDHPVGVYLIQAQLAAYRNYDYGFKKAYVDVTQNSVKRTLAFELAKELVSDLDKMLSNLNATDPAKQQTLDFWISTFDIQ